MARKILPKKTPLNYRIKDLSLINTLLEKKPITQKEAIS